MYRVEKTKGKRVVIWTYANEFKTPPLELEVSIRCSRQDRGPLTSVTQSVANWDILDAFLGLFLVSILREFRVDDGEIEWIDTLNEDFLSTESGELTEYGHDLWVRGFEKTEASEVILCLYCKILVRIFILASAAVPAPVLDRGN